MGVHRGWRGLIDNEMERMNARSVAGIVKLGGTVLRSSRCPEFREPEAREKAASHLLERGIDGLVVIGGDGSLNGASELARQTNLPLIGIPKTIDNDVGGTDYALGFDTAVNTAVEAIDKIRDTATSHERLFLVEVMGRNAGWLALHSGIASGSDVILLPEIPFDIEDVCHTVETRAQRKHGFTIVCCSEGAKPKGGKQIVDRVIESSPDPVRLGGVGKFVADQIEEKTGIESRAVVLGHVQRGGVPVAADRVLATQFGHAAMKLLRMGIKNRLVVMRNGLLDHVEITSAADKQRLIEPDNDPLVEAARSVYTCFGDWKTKIV